MKWLNHFRLVIGVVIHRYSFKKGASKNNLPIIAYAKLKTANLSEFHFIDAARYLLQIKHQLP